MSKEKKDPLDIDYKDTAKTLVKGAVTLAIVVPVLTGVSSWLGGKH
jgi:hypothetical protein